jgi:hypothetical protein
MSYISGEYYTVNPIAIRSSLDVYAENARVIVPMDSPEFGRVYNACIGAMMVGSIKFTKKEGDAVKRGEEYGTSIDIALSAWEHSTDVYLHRLLRIWRKHDCMLIRAQHRTIRQRYPPELGCLYRDARAGGHEDRQEH